MSGRLKNRAFICQRLSKASKDVLEHRPRTWDTVSLTPNFHLLITAIGVYVPSSGGSEVVIKVDARPLKDPLRPIDKLRWNRNEMSMQISRQLLPSFQGSLSL
eukprot:03798.XXX_170840_169792_1 [CDS] Oithona nana genome sequencing.